MIKKNNNNKRPTIRQHTVIEHCLHQVRCRVVRLIVKRLTKAEGYCNSIFVPLLICVDPVEYITETLWSVSQQPILPAGKTNVCNSNSVIKKIYISTKISTFAKKICFNFKCNHRLPHFQVLYIGSAVV